MARTLRPGVLMTAYLVLFLAIGPWPGVHGVPATAHALARDGSLPAAAIAAFLSWRVTRGSGFARGLILLWTAGGFAVTFGSAAMQSGSLVPCWLLAGCAGQLALLLAAPVYDRTRKDSLARYHRPVSLWPAPPRWMLPGAAAAAMLGMLLGLGSMDYRAGPGCTAASCRTLGQGYPVHFLATAQGVSLDDGVRSFFSDLASAAYNAGALAEDLTLWFVAAFALIYVLWLPSRRPEESPAVTSLGAPDPLAGH
jgi:hypothetical protein